MSAPGFTLRGVDDWVGIWFATQGLEAGELAAVRTAILRAYEAGDEVHAYAFGYLLAFGRSRRFRAHTCAGTPLRGHTDGSAWSFDPSAASSDVVDLESDAGPRDVVWVHHHGRRQALAKSLATRVDPSAWIDLGPLELVELRALDPRPTRPPPPEAPEAPPDMDALLEPGRPDFSSERAKTMDELRKLLVQSKGKPKAEGVAGWGQERPKADPGWFDRARKWVAEVAFRTPALAEALGRRQAKYMRKLAEMFEHGRLDDALRHAIPLQGWAESQSEVERRRSMGLPTPRMNLEISRTQADISSETLIPDAFRRRLEAYYRESAKQLEAEGRIDEAAFVWFELLRDGHSGIALLERHERWALAAEIATAREMDPALVIRLWFLAKQPSRAIQVARRSGRFAEAVTLLERREPKLAERLRVSWARHAASLGDFVTAVDAAWPVASMREEAKAWFDRALGYAGPEARATLWMRRAIESNATEVDAVEALVAAITSEAADAAHFRLALGRKLRAHPNAREVVPRYGRLLVRPLLRDLESPYGELARTELRALFEAHADDRIRTDLPPLEVEGVVPLLERHAGFEHELALTGAGHECARDLVALPDGSCLVALGESGLVRLDPSGRVLSRSLAAARALVGPGHGGMALALHPRGEFLQVQRLELARGRTRPWADLEAYCVANALFDGIFVVARATTLGPPRVTLDALDLVGERPRSVWRVDLEPHERVVQIHVATERLFVSVLGIPSGPDERPTRDAPYLEIWEFALPSLVLRRRHPLNAMGIDLERVVDVRLAADLLMVSARTPTSHRPVLSIFDLQRRELGVPRAESERHAVAGAKPVTNLEGEREPLFADERALAWSMPDASGRTLVLAERKALEPRVRLRCRGSSTLRASMHAERLWAADDLGRVWTLDLRSGAVFGPWTLDRFV